LRRQSEKCVNEGSKYAHLIGLYLSFHLNWVLGPFVHGKLQNLKTSKDTLGHDITSLNKMVLLCQWVPGNNPLVSSSLLLGAYIMGGFNDLYT